MKKIMFCSVLLFFLCIHADESAVDTLRAALIRGDVDLIKNLLIQGGVVIDTPVSIEGSRKIPLFHAAAWYGKDDIIRELLQMHRRALYLRDSSTRCYPLEYAVMNNHVSTARLLYDEYSKRVGWCFENGVVYSHDYSNMLRRAHDIALKNNYQTMLEIFQGREL